MKRFLTLTLLLFTTTYTFAQDMTNLVPNPGFDEEDGRLKRLGDIDAAKHWTSPTDVPADIFEEDHRKEDVSAPYNEYGKEKPISGSRYAGIRFFSYKGKEPRSYLQVQLLSPLKKDVKYCVQFHVSLSDLSKYAANNLGAHLSKKAINAKDESSLLVDTHVKHSSNKIYNEQYMWEPVCGVYTAEGGEKYLTIGNFSSDRETEYDKMKRPKEFRQPQNADAYYYVEDVSVKPLSDKVKCDCEKSSAQGNTRPKLVYSKQLLIDENTTDEQVVSFSTIYFDYLSNELEPASKNDLNRLADVLKDNPSMKLKVIGHMDNEEAETSGSLNDYELLGDQRADNALKYLVKKGISKDRLEAVSKKNEDPADGRDTDLAKAKNRRVEFEIK